MGDFDADAARQRYAVEETDELVRIAYVQRDNYVPEAVAIAKEELARRGIASGQDEQVAVSVQAIEKEDAVRRDIANQPLGIGYKIVCFIFADIVAIVIAVLHYQSGKRRAAREAWKWIGFGWIFRLAIFLLIMVPIWFTHGF